MAEHIITIRDLSKRYRIGMKNAGYRTLRESIMDGVKAPFKNLRNLRKLTKFDDTSNNTNGEDIIWALKDVSFNVNEGEVSGIIGRNGAGKSTLLKILSRITEPSGGEVRINGRVSSLLEVGTGFHPELTGRENIYLNGTILGMRKNEIDRKFDEIVAFSEIEKFLDTPVKRYSSGMYVRLAFAVAAHLEPEILMIDEVLAVGDAAFQKKCLGKMGDVAKEGRTVLFVSHNMSAVQALCNNVIWLNQGQVHDIGSAGTIVKDYMSTAVEAVPERQWNDPQTAPGNDEIRIHRIFAHPFPDEKERTLTIDQAMEIGVEFWSLKPDQDLSITFHVFTSEGALAFSTSALHNPLLRGKLLDQGLYRSLCRIPANFLNNNAYYIKLIVVKNQTKGVFKIDEALAFEMLDSVESRGAYHGRRPGAVAPVLTWDMLHLSENLSSKKKVFEANGKETIQ